MQRWARSLDICTNDLRRKFSGDALMSVKQGDALMSVKQGDALTSSCVAQQERLFVVAQQGRSVVLAGVLVHYDHGDSNQDECDADQ